MHFCKDLKCWEEPLAIFTLYASYIIVIAVVSSLYIKSSEIAFIVYFSSVKTL